MFKGQIILIGGTCEAPVIAQKFCGLGINVTATAVTEIGAKIMDGIKKVDVKTARLDKEGFRKLFNEVKPKVVIDASHPYAQEVKKIVIDLCSEMGMPYIRFERKSVNSDKYNVSYCNNYKEAARFLDKTKGKILFTTGSNSLDIFSKRIKNFPQRAVVRVLPVSSIIKRCEEEGLDFENIIAAKGPFSMDMNCALIRHVKASILVTKESGIEGGFLEKLKAAQKEGIKTVVIKRPDINRNINRAKKCEINTGIIKIFDGIDEVVEYAQRIFKLG